MSGRRLIVNADDLGLSRAVNQGIIELHTAGVVTSASLLMNLPATAHALDRTAGTDLDIGVHLNLTVGAPLAHDVPSLVGSDGRFGRGLALRRLARRQVRLEEVEREWAAQIEAFLATGRPAAHLDSHLHIHALPGLMAVTLRLAQRYGIGAVRLRGHGLVVQQAVPVMPTWLATRWRMQLARRADATDVLTSDYLLVLTMMGPRCTAGPVKALLRRLPAGLTELVTHPGYVDEELCRLDPLRWQRERELQFLRSEAWRALLAESGTELTTFHREVTRGSA